MPRTPRTRRCCTSPLAASRRSSRTPHGRAASTSTSGRLPTSTSRRHERVARHDEPELNSGHTLPDVCVGSIIAHSERERGVRISVVGQSVKRKDGIGKATGRTRYADDLVFPGMLHARTVRATIPCGRIRSIKLDFDTAGFVICDWRDVPGRNIVALIEDDQPCLVEREVRHLAEPVLLLAHEDRERLLAARVEIEYERDAEPVLD